MNLSHEALNERFHVDEAFDHIAEKRFDSELEDTRVLNDAIASVLNQILESRVAFEGNVTTTLHNEKVIISVPHQRNPYHVGDQVGAFFDRFDYRPDNRDEYIDEFCSIGAGLVASLYELEIEPTVESIVFEPVQ